MEPRDIVQTLSAGSLLFSTLTQAVVDAGLAGTLKSFRAVTVFAPTNDAFKAAGGAVTDFVSKHSLQELLLFHTLDFAAPSANLKAGQTFKTMLPGHSVRIEEEGGNLYVQQINGNARAKVVLEDVAFNTGFIHALDAVLIPTMAIASTAAPARPTVAELVSGTESLSTLRMLATKTGFMQELAEEGPLTVFAPTDTAFGFFALAANASNDAILMLLRNHVTNGAAAAADLSDSMAIETQAGGILTVVISEGGVVRIRTEGGIVATVTLADILAFNGIVHIVDVVLEPKSTAPSLLTIAGFIRVQENLSTLKTAVDTLGIMSLFESDMQEFTVFAPTNDAFDLLGASTVSSLLDDADALKKLLT